MPDLGVQPGRGQLLASDQIRTAQRIESVGGNLTDNPDTQTGPRKRLARNDFLGQPEFASDRPNLILEQQSQRLDECELQIRGQTANVVMTLDVGSATASTGLDDIGVQRALDQKFDLVILGIVVSQQVSHRTFEGPDELAADDLALTLRIDHARKRFQEFLLRVNRHQPGTGGRHEIPLHLGTLTGAQQTVIDEYTRQPVADGPLDQCGRNCGVHTAGKSADGVSVADLLTHRLDERLGDIGRRPVRADTGELMQEPAEHLLAVRGVDHLGVILHPGETAAAILEGRHRCAGAGRHHLEAGGRGSHRVAMAHPHRLITGQSRMQFATKDIHLSAAVLAGAGTSDGATEGLGHGLESVADTEHRDAEIEHRWIELGRTVGIYAGRPAGEHDGPRVLGLDLLDGRGVCNDLGEDPGLTDPPGDQLGVLGAEVDHQDWAGRGWVWLHRHSLEAGM